MSFSIILCNGDGSEVERCWRKGNEEYLIIENGSLLQDLDLTSYDVFSADDSTFLVEDLESAKAGAQNAEEVAHVEHIQTLVRLTMAVKGRTIVFTPFERLA